MNMLKRLITRAMYGKVSKLDELYQCHKGEECYLFGDGISLKWMDLNEFSNKDSILGGLTLYHKDVSVLSVKYCAFIEPWWFWPIFPLGGWKKFNYIKHTIHLEYRKAMAKHPKILFFLNVSNYPLMFRHKNIQYISRWYNPPFESKNPFKSRGDAHHGTFKFELSLAIFLGYKKAYLVGHDYTHIPSKNLHFYEKGEGILNGKKDFNREFIDYAKNYIELVTVTVDGGSDTLNSITYKELTGKDPVFRENTEIVSMERLRSLDTWYDYSIF